ncbi:sugar transferase [Oricola sp.]|uniref:sugar transferase n=1 Tax=Oricola sp. TaxID=1979950 RepID=UPI003BAD5378
MNPSFSLHHARSEAARNSKNRIPRYVTRIRFQLSAAMLLSVIVPVVLSGGLQCPNGIPDTVSNTTFGALFAVLASFVLVRRLHGFPGVQTGIYTLFAVSMPFAVLAVFLLVFRLEYSRFILFVSYAMALSWFSVSQWLYERFIRLQLAAVPGGNVTDLLSIDKANWTVLQSPGAPPGQVAGIVADLRSNLGEEWEKYLADATLSGIPVYHTKQVAESLTGRVRIDHLSENGFGSLLPNLIYLRAKQMIDWVGALVALPFFGLVLLVVGPLILVTSGRPVFFLQRRIGYRGKEFVVFKFRTMTNRKPNVSDREAAQTKQDDQRITAVGGVLRRYRIDELPQILNILKGEMSWIGPRPEAVPLSQWYEQELPFYRYRHVVRPGISGWAQVNQGHVYESDDVLEKLHYDFFYIKYLSFWLDCLIALRTIETMVRGFGSK